ncbi:MAG TPA: hypothetical protein VH643_33965 [Gemmataceae bacterium]
MLKKILSALFAAVAVCMAASTVRAQVPFARNPRQPPPGLPPMNGGFDGRGNVPPGVFPPPPAVPILRDREKRRDEQDAASGILRMVPHMHVPPAVSNPEHMKDFRPPKAVPPEMVMPASEFRFAPPKFAPVASEGGTFVRGFSSWRGGGILAGIGGAIAAVFGGIFGRKKES